MLMVTNKQRVSSRGIEKIGLTSDKISKAEEDYRNANRSRSGNNLNFPDRIYRRVRKNPLLIVHLLAIGRNNEEALLHESYLGYHGRMLFFVQLIFSTRYDWGLPRWIIRLRMAQPKRLSTCWLAQLRAFSLSPMRCL